MQGNEKKSRREQPHTRVPNLVYDIVLWLVDPAERDCLLYIVRRTYGFVGESGSGRKARDMISLEQFEKGIVTGDYLRDLGINRTRNTIRKALGSLQQKGLVDARHFCGNCRWEQHPEAATKLDERSNAASCPRCGASLSKSYALAPLTPRKLENLLNEHDPQNRSFKWDGQFFRVENSTEKRQCRDMDAEARRLRDLMWYPDLVDKAIELAGKKLKGGKVSASRKVNGFYKPIWELQEQYPNPPLIKYALEQTIAGPVFKGDKTSSWHRYALAVAKNSKHKFDSPPDGGGNDLRQREMSMRDLLRRAAELNGNGDFTEARSLLADILSQVKDLAPIFGGDEKRCEDQLRLAFKQGSEDFAGESVDRFSPIDYYPEWSYPASAKA